MKMIILIIQYVLNDNYKKIKSNIYIYTMEDISMLINGGKINVKKKISKTPRKSLSKEYKSFLQKSKKNSKSNPKKVVTNLKIVKVNKENKEKNFVKVVNNKDENKSKNKFTKKSQAKKKQRASKRKKIHRKITRSKTLSFKCNDKRLNVKKIIKEVQKKSNTEIKEELKKKGIEIKSNKNKLLKDLYLFTQCDNINIVKE